MKNIKNDEIVIQYFDSNGELLLKCGLLSTPLREEAVLSVCLEFFDDPEPCMLHRSAAMSRIYMELHEYFQKALQANINRFAIADLPEKIYSFFDINNCHEIIIYKQ